MLFAHKSRINQVRGRGSSVRAYNLYGWKYVFRLVFVPCLRKCRKVNVGRSVRVLKVSNWWLQAVKYAWW